MKLKKLSECTINEAVLAWNRGFEGYFVKIEMNADTFMQRVISEGLSLEKSSVLFEGEEPIAIIMNGFRLVDGKKTAWNGGTGVASEYRGKGASKLIMEESMRMYVEEGVEVATLEAIKENEKAIRLYEKFGYRVTGSLVYLSGFLNKDVQSKMNIHTDAIRPEQLSSHSFYNENVPWQCGWQSAKQGEAHIYYDHEQHPVGYSIFRKVWNQKGKLEKVILHQIELLHNEAQKLLPVILKKIAGEEIHSISFLTINFDANDPVTLFLLENGLQKSVEQVRMIKDID